MILFCLVYKVVERIIRDGSCGDDWKILIFYLYIDDDDNEGIGDDSGLVFWVFNKRLEVGWISMLCDFR